MAMRLRDIAWRKPTNLQLLGIFILTVLPAWCIFITILTPTLLQTWGIDILTIVVIVAYSRMMDLRPEHSWSLVAGHYMPASLDDPDKWTEQLNWLCSNIHANRVFYNMNQGSFVFLSKKDAMLFKLVTG